MIQFRPKADTEEINMQSLNHPIASRKLDILTLADKTDRLVS